MPLLEVANIGKKFGKVDVLKDISFDLDKGETLSIIGSSGSGKTTLLRCLTFLERADKGKVSVNGELIFDADEKTVPSEAEQRRRQTYFGLVFQNFNLFPQYTVLENVTLASVLKSGCKKNTAEYRAIEENALELIDKVGLSERRDYYPCKLSGGQQQRVAIARALAQKPDILCFDEPTSALDPELTGEVLKVIKQLAANDTTMIIVTHEMSFAHAVSDKVIFMDSGIIAEQGDPNALFDNPQSPRLQAFLNAEYNQY